MLARTKLPPLVLDEAPKFSCSHLLRMVGLLGELGYYFFAISKLTALGLESGKLLLGSKPLLPESASAHRLLCRAPCQKQEWALGR